MERHFADRYGAQKFGVISSTVVLVMDVSIRATASCFGVDTFRPPPPCFKYAQCVSAGEKSECHKDLSHCVHAGCGLHLIEVQVR